VTAPAAPATPPDAFGRGEVVVVAGLSGAGRSTAADALEDVGWFVIDNLPPSLIPKVAELTEGTGNADYRRIALVVGTGQHQADVLPALQWLGTSGLRVRTLFLDASTEMLVLRYKVGRRRHPLSLGSLTDAVERERQVLEPVRAVADLVVDTTNLNVHQLRDRVLEAFAPADASRTLHTRVESFGYKQGVPTDADMVLDCRFLPNPHWVEDLRPLSGLDEAVRRYVLDQPITGQFLAQLDGLFSLLVPAFEAEGKTYLTIAFGCTGGRHRSVAIAEEVGRMLSRLGVEPQVDHRDIDR
jgi:RNase adapter protein RapZ